MKETLNPVGKSDLDLIPRPDDLASLLEIECCVPDHELIVTQMFNPLSDVLTSSGKRFRAEMLGIAFKALGGQMSELASQRLRICELIIEGLHLGSMIIDDIQDQSDVRRGRATLHRKYGLSIALNAGNWLYFQAIGLIQKLDLEPAQEIQLQRQVNQVLLRAHVGQGIDVGVNMNILPQNRVESAYFMAAELKTGALMGLVFSLAAVVAKSGQESQKVLFKMAKKFGVALQMLDDIGNFSAPPPKGMEDLRIGRPSFIWVVAARMASTADYERFRFATRMLPDTSFIDSWQALFHLIPRAREAAAEFIRNLKLEFLQGVGDPSSCGSEDLNRQIDSLFSRLERAYG